jgi:hypothetical protein
VSVARRVLRMGDPGHPLEFVRLLRIGCPALLPELSAGARDVAENK